ncbi:MAG: 30S ribosomal protein S10 [Candidatus Aenigmarchaeota archaeon]|nr:30S ribosomal protein S10 [Candidatus Aenigmarchaeota archaeon]
MQIARMKLTSNSIESLNSTINEIKSLSMRFKAKIKGPIMLPTKKLSIVTRKAVSGDGTSTYEKWEMRIHKRLIDIGMNERILKHIMRMEMPDSVNIEIRLIERKI